jgi:ATP-binding cassette, subfamily B (MDR/TAP), member 1
MNAVFSAKAAGAMVFAVCKRTPLIDGLSEEGLVPSKPIDGQVEFRNVRFCYPSRPDVVVCKNYNLTITAGQVVALCGMSGCVSNLHLNPIFYLLDWVSSNV